MANDEVQEIKQKIDIASFIGQTVELKKAGTNMRGLCPFHRESTPSFFVSPDRQSWHCFGCKKGGDLFTFVMEQEGLDFVGALELLAEKAGVTLGSYDPIKNESGKKLRSVMEAAQAFFAQQLYENEGETALSYLHEIRQLDDELIKTFEIGFAPDSWNKTGEYLMQEGFTETQLADAGLIVHKDGGGWYDRFRNRVTFPIFNKLGQLVGFSGRTLDKDPKSAKYINTPETPLFKKGELLFGLKQAKDAIQTKDYAIVVEGQIDAISLRKIGIKNAVAPLGTALTVEQLTYLKRLSPRMMLLFDSDTAGQEATLRSVEAGIKLGMDIKVAHFRHGKDPDEAIAHSKEEAIQDLKTAQEYLVYLLEIARTRFDSSQSTYTSRMAEFLLKYVRAVDNPVQQESMLQTISRKLNVSTNSLEKLLGRSERDTKSADIPTKHEAIIQQNRTTNLWHQLNAMLLQLPVELEADAQLLDIVKDVPLREPINKRIEIGQRIIKHLQEQHKIDHQILDQGLSDDERKYIDITSLTDLGEILSSEETYLTTLEHVVRDLQIEEVKQEISLIKSSGGDATTRLTRLQTLSQKLKELQSQLQT